MLKKKKQTNNIEMIYFKEVVKLTDEELKNHKQYLKEHLKNKF